jgi:hypothetical protein
MPNLRDLQIWCMVFVTWGQFVYWAELTSLYAVGGKPIVHKGNVGRSYKFILFRHRF